MKLLVLPGELGQSLQEPGGVAVHRHAAAALEASRCSQRSPPLLPGAEPRVAPPNYHQLATTAPATQRQEGGISAGASMTRCSLPAAGTRIPTIYANIPAVCQDPPYVYLLLFIVMVLLPKVWLL